MARSRLSVPHGVSLRRDQFSPEPPHVSCTILEAPGCGWVSGRIERLHSGKSARFVSQGRLNEFIARILSEEENK